MLLDNGNLRNRRSDRTEAYYMTLLNGRSIDDIMKLQEQVYQALPNKEVLAKDSAEDLENALSGGGFIIGVHNLEHQLISYRFISKPANHPSNMGKDIRLDPHALTKVAHLETTVVHPDYRGNDLQSKTLQVAFPMLQNQGIGHVICTVSPFNLFSLTNIMKNGLKIKALAKKYGKAPDGSDGLWRFILHRDLESLACTKILDNVVVPTQHFSAQERLLGNGFVGDSISKDGSFVCFVR